jgi:hypothetical protein
MAAAGVASTDGSVLSDERGRRRRRSLGRLTRIQHATVIPPQRHSAVV